MKKASLCVALCAALSLVAAGADAQGSKSSKSSKSSKAKVTVSKRAPAAPPMVANFNACVASGVGIFTVVTSVGCAVVWAIPIGVEALFVPRRA
ncbi:MAG TPA: hypothetical protein VFA53_01570 [Xanthobacteraceae bacterium]|nr:hypothetical protein [Xanthobacteraceae bacterium]